MVPATRLARLMLSFDQCYRSTAVIYPLLFLSPSLFQSYVYVYTHQDISYHMMSRKGFRFSIHHFKAKCEQAWTVDMDMVSNLPAHWTAVGVGALFDEGKPGGIGALLALVDISPFSIHFSVLVGKGNRRLY